MIAAKTKVILFNAGAILIAVGALIGVGRSIFSPSTTQPCGDRYTNSTVFGLDRDGAILTAADLLARIGNDGSGVTENVDVVRPRDTRVPAAMRINLRTGPASPGSDTKAGIAFRWQPRSVQNQVAACLSYSVFFFGELEFQGGGVLPGLQGVDQSQQTRDGFAAHLAWRQDGRPGATLALTTNGENQTIRLESKGVTFPRGQWVKIDQEIVLNAADQANGIFRVWVDGALAIERADIAFRAKPAVTLAGVAVNVAYGTAEATAWAPSDTKIWVSPFDMSWR